MQYQQNGMRLFLLRQLQKQQLIRRNFAEHYDHYADTSKLARHGHYWATLKYALAATKGAQNNEVLKLHHSSKQRTITSAACNKYLPEMCFRLKNFEIESQEKRIARMSKRIETDGAILTERKLKQSKKFNYGATGLPLNLQTIVEQNKAVLRGISVKGPEEDEEGDDRKL